MNQNIRSAAIGGLAATFVVAAALAPKMLDRQSGVEFHQTAATEETTTTTVPETTATTDTTETSAPIEQRVTVVEQKVAQIEATTTTTLQLPHDECGHPYSTPLPEYADTTWSMTYEGDLITYTATNPDATKVGRVPNVPIRVHFPSHGTDIYTDAHLSAAFICGDTKTLTLHIDNPYGDPISSVEVIN